MYWKKENGSEDFIEICEYLAERKNDYYTYQHYPSPLYHAKYPILNKGWNTQLKEMKENAKAHVKSVSGTKPMLEEEKVSLYEITMISYLNRWANSNIGWKNGKGGRERFAEAKDMVYYFKKEANFQ